jgi:hypothetical protein
MTNSVWTLAIDPLVPLWLLATLAILATLVAGVVLVLGGRRAILRALALAILTLALVDPSAVRENREPVKDIVAVVVDRSGSNRLADRAAQTDAAMISLESQLAALPEVEARMIDAQSGAGVDGTRLFESLARALADIPAERVAGAIIVTDGQIHDVPASLEAMGLKAPLHVLVTGRTTEVDRRLALLESPRFGIVGKDQMLRLRLDETNGTGRAGIIIRKDGVEIGRRDIIAGQIVQVPVRIDRGGPNVIEVEAASLPNELTLANNRVVVTVEGVRDKLRVLLVSGEPHAGERTWRNLLKADPNVDLVHFTILRPPEKQDGTPIHELSLIAFPTRELFQQKIKEFDLIIFDRYANQSILPAVYFENIVRYVREGGALMIAAGPEFAGSGSLYRSPLAAILPAQPDGRVIDEAYKAQVSSIGRRHPVTRDLPGSEASPPAWGEWLRLVGATTRSGSAVLNGPQDRPLLLLNREGKGRVALFLSDHAWLWARGYRDGGPHLDLLRRLGHWLMKEPELEEEALRATARGQTIEVERQTLGETPAALTITGPNGETRNAVFELLRPGLFRARLQATEMGLHRASADGLNTFFSVGSENPREFSDVVSTTVLTQAMAEASGGSVRRIGRLEVATVDVPRILMVRSGSQFAGSDWIGLRHSGTGIVRGVSVTPLFLGLLGMLVLLGALIAGWIGEGGWHRLRKQA